MVTLLHREMQGIMPDVSNNCYLETCMPPIKRGGSLCFLKLRPHVRTAISAKFVRATWVHPTLNRQRRIRMKN